jgi:predicted subunit of tRNA(5-methylaminomethyl-2-thiouridylate) methyltransferase
LKSIPPHENVKNHDRQAEKCPAATKLLKITVNLRNNKFYVKPLSHLGWKTAQKIKENRFSLSSCDRADESGIFLT